MGDENIFHIAAVATGFCIEIDTAGSESTSIHDDQHGFNDFIKVDGELVRIPSILIIAPVGVNGAEQVILDRYI